MKEEKWTTISLFAIFALRKQLHGYIDIFEEDRDYLNNLLYSETVEHLLSSKRVMLKNTDSTFLTFVNSSIEDTELFHPFEESWIEKSAICDVSNSAVLIERLINFDKYIMVWCHFFMTEDETDAEEAGYFLSMIQSAKSDIDYLNSLAR